MYCARPTKGAALAVSYSFNWSMACRIRSSAICFDFSRPKREGYVVFALARSFPAVLPCTGNIVLTMASMSHNFGKNCEWMTRQLNTCSMCSIDKVAQSQSKQLQRPCQVTTLQFSGAAGIFWGSREVQKRSTLLNAAYSILIFKQRHLEVRSKPYQLFCGSWDVQNVIYNLES